MNIDAFQVLFTVQAAYHTVAVDLNLVPDCLKAVKIDLYAAKFIPAVNQMHLANYPGKIQCFFQGRISAADNSDSLVPVKVAIAKRAVGYSPTNQPFLVFQAKMAMFGTCADNDCLCMVFLFAAGGNNFEIAGAAAYRTNLAARPFDIWRILDVVGKKIGQLISFYACGITRIIFQGFREQNLAAGCKLLEKQHGTPGTAKIKSRCYAGRPSPNDNGIIYFHARAFVSRNALRSFFGRPPMSVSTRLPFLISTIVGMELMPNLAAVTGFSSTLTLQILTRPLYSSASSSMIGPTARQGPHQGAQKSTRTGIFDFSTAELNVASVICSAIIISLFLFPTSGEGVAGMGKA